MELDIVDTKINQKLRELRLKNSLDVLNTIDISSNIKESLRVMIYNRLKNIEDFYKVPIREKPKAVIAFSGGVDSTAASIIAKHIFDVKAVSCYSEYIITDEMKDVIKNIAKTIGIDLKFLDICLEDIYNGVISGRFHPCGRCHNIIENTVIEYAKKINAKYVIFGDLLAFGYLSLYNKNGIFRFNLPSFFALTKEEERTILKNHGIILSMKYGCPLLRAYHKYKGSFKFTIQRILREVRGRVVSEEEGVKNIMDVFHISQIDK